MNEPESVRALALSCFTDESEISLICDIFRFELELAPALLKSNFTFTAAAAAASACCCKVTIPPVDFFGLLLSFFPRAIFQIMRDE